MDSQYIFKIDKQFLIALLLKVTFKGVSNIKINIRENNEKTFN